MISRAELKYVEKLVAAISYHNVKNIPFGERRFQEGVGRLAKVFEDHADEFKDAKKIRLLFIRKPITGTYDRMLEAFQYFNGRAVGLKNPRYENTQINVSRIRAEKLLDIGKNDFPKEVMLEGAKSFCAGAGVNH